jgi:phytoene dehydrogenase-like protein
MPAVRRLRWLDDDYRKGDAGRVPPCHRLRCRKSGNRSNDVHANAATAANQASFQQARGLRSTHRKAVPIMPAVLEIAPAAHHSRTVDRFATFDRDRFDVIVIGAGTGVLTAAALLAKRGVSVLVVDSHYVPGGNASVFHRPHYTFDVGAHYVGDCGPGGSVPRILNAAGVRDLRFNELDPDGFDTICLPDCTFRVPKGIDAFRARLIARFPHDARGIDRYIDAIRGIGSLPEMRGGIADVVSTLWRACLGLRYAGSTVRRFLDSCTGNERLRAILTGHNGTYAEPPSRASFAVHAMVTAGYLRGAYYPAGGAQAISDALVRVIEAHGGKVLLYSTATRIVVERSRVTGVAIESRRIGRRIAEAPVVLSDADLKRTMLELVGPSQLKTHTIERIRRYEMAPALGVVHLGIARDFRLEGVPRTNFFVHPSYDQEAVYAEARAGRFLEAPPCFVSIATLKDPGNAALAPPGHTNMQLIAVAPSQPEAWGTDANAVASGAYHHSTAYEDAKRRFAKRLIATVERTFPRLSRDITYLEVSTPLTQSRFTHSTGGTSYGLAHIPSQTLWRRPCTATEIGGLYLCGANTMTGHGIVGTMWSGVMAASQIARANVLTE